MLLVVSDSCKWCKKLANESLVDPKVKAYVDQKYIPIVVKRNEKASFPEIYQSPRIPVVYYIDPKAQDVWQTIGYKNAPDLLQEFREAEISYNEELAGISY